MKSPLRAAFDLHDVARREGLKARRPLADNDDGVSSCGGLAGVGEDIRPGGGVILEDGRVHVRIGASGGDARRRGVAGGRREVACEAEARDALLLEAGPEQQGFALDEMGRGVAHD